MAAGDPAAAVLYEGPRLSFGETSFFRKDGDSHINHFRFRIALDTER